MNEALTRVAKRISGIRSEVSAQDVWLYLAAQYPSQADKYNSVLYLLEFRGIDPVLLLEAARLHISNTTPVKVGDATLVGSWFPTVAQLKDAVRSAECERDMLALQCKQALRWGDALPMTLGELAVQVGVQEIELDFFLPEYRYQMSLREGDEENGVETAEEDFDDDEMFAREPLPTAEYDPIWGAACQELGVWLPQSKQWLEQLELEEVQQGETGAAVLVLAAPNDLVRDFFATAKSRLMTILQVRATAVGLVIEDVLAVVYEEVEA